MEMFMLGVLYEIISKLVNLDIVGVVIIVLFSSII